MENETKWCEESKKKKGMAGTPRNDYNAEGRYGMQKRAGASSPQLQTKRWNVWLQVRKKKKDEEQKKKKKTERVTSWSGDKRESWPRIALNEGDETLFPQNYVNKKLGRRNQLQKKKGE